MAARPTPSQEDLNKVVVELHHKQQASAYGCLGELNCGLVGCNRGAQDSCDAAAFPRRRRSVGRGSRGSGAWG